MEKKETEPTVTKEDRYEQLRQTMDLHYNNLEETEQDRLDEKRYAEKRSMTEDQKKEVLSRITEESAAMIEKMIAASGEKPA